MVYYLKYRPQTIDELDSGAVREKLASVLSRESIPHAFLFTGPKGLGKTSSARIVAKVVNCTAPEKKRKDGFEPCNECDACKSITNGSNLDILEIDAASNRGIDEIRELKEKIRLAPVSSKKKVYIIDEVHMLTTEAFNALLKTLEEPPSHAIFILATTEAHKVPSTITSRCLHVGFKKATSAELVRSFERIVKGEGIKIDKKALEYIASLSDGAFRDGVKILEEIGFIAGKKSVSVDLIEEKYKVISLGKDVEDFIISLKERDVKKLLNLISSMVESGGDIRYFIQKTIDLLHEELVAIVREDKRDGLGLDLGQIKSLLEVLARAYLETKQAVLPQLPLELAVIEFVSQNKEQQDLDRSEKTSKQSVRQSQSQRETETRIQSANIIDMRKQQGNIKKITAMYGSVKQVSKDEKGNENKESRASLLHVSNGDITSEWLDTFWRSLISEMKGFNHTIAGVLRGCKIEKFDKEGIIIETPFKFHKERLDDSKTINEIARVTKLLTGREMKVEVQLKK